MASASQSTLAVVSAKNAFVFDWARKAEASSPSTWNTSLKYSHSPKARRKDNTNSPIQRRKRKGSRKPLDHTSGNTMPQRDNVIGGEDQDISAEKTQDNPRHSPRKGSPKKKSPDHERTPRQRFLRASALRYNQRLSTPSQH